MKHGQATVSKRYFALLVAATCLGAGASARAQGVDGADTHGSVTSAPPRASDGQSANPQVSSGATPLPMLAPAPTETLASMRRERALLGYTGKEYSIGWRAWAMAVPNFIVNIFAHSEPGWGSGLQIATGPEFVYRNRNFDIVLGAMYVSYRANEGYFHGVHEGPLATERVQPSLFGMYLTAHFLWGIRFHRMFQIQIGPGLGVGFIGGNLYRTQATMRDGAWEECRMPGAGVECGTENNHYPNQPPPVGDLQNNGRYREPNWFGGGGVPGIMPWISLPHVAFHVRPHRHFDLKIEGGYAILGFYGGGSIHYIF